MLKVRSKLLDCIHLHSSPQSFVSLRTQNLVTLVTGGASGLGRATAERFASKGAQVVLCDLGTSKGADVAAEIGNDTLYVPADVSSENDIKALMATTKEKFGRLDVIVNCAGLSIAYETYNFHNQRPHMVEDFLKLLMVSTGATSHWSQVNEMSRLNMVSG